MEELDQKSPRKHRLIVGIITGLTVLFGLGIIFWLMWTFAFAEHFANCNGNITVWRRDAFLSYSYEIRDGIIPLETGLSYKELDASLDKRGCSCVVIINEA